MRFDWLESYLAFAETLNFTRAAEKLHLSQPALHLQVKRLGAELGVELYRREGRGLVLTDDGRRVEAFAREITARTRSFSADIRSSSDTTPPVLVAGRATHLDMLSQPLRKWVRRKRPLTLRAGDRETIVEDLVSGRAHVGVAPLERDEPGLLAYPFRRVGQMAVVARNHPLASQSRVGLAALLRHPLILPPRNRPHREGLSRALLRELGQEPQVAVEAEGWDLMMLYASLGLGVAVVNDSCTVPAGAVSVPVTGVPALQFYLLVREGALLPPFAEELKEHLLAETA